jgi:conjugative transfer signal peptidase TraF
MSKSIAVLAITGVAAVLASVLPRQPLIIWNASSSVPIGFFAIERRPLRRGDLALVKLPPTIAASAADRGYLPRSAYLIKPVAAIGGDRVCRIGRSILIRGRLAAAAASRDAAGRPMLQWHGCRVLRSGELFVVSTGLNSFDGRYFGAVTSQNAVGAASSIWSYLTEQHAERPASTGFIGPF